MAAGNPEDHLFEIIADCVRRIEEEGAPALDQVCAAHPGDASVIRRRVEWLIGMGLAATPEPRQATVPERLGDYRLLEYLGGGGMGVVYVARQESLSREVALKLIRPEHLYFPGARERFRREVEVVARLQHPGIVPIYTVGEEGGIPYFAMERIAGCSLAQALEALAGHAPASVTGSEIARVVAAHSGQTPLDEATATTRFGGSLVDAAMRIVRQVADALRHAHERGVVHRDIKPSNVMLTIDGRALLLDFGLASHGGMNRLTRSMARLGSVPYMSPEQVHGRTDEVDARSDVYSLGTTLYELLTLKPPYLAGDDEATRRLILAAAPDSIRSHNATVAWDVETVCLTAMEHARERRYASAGALIADLDNILHLRPITARRPGVVLRCRRWMQRHPAWTASIALVWLLMFAWALIERNARHRVQAQQDIADQEHARATGHFHKVLDAMNQLLERVEAIANDGPEMEGLRTNLLRDALAIYGSFEGNEAVDPALRWETARAHHRLGDIHQSLGNLAEAEKSYRDALALFEQLRAERRDDDALLQEQVSCWRGLITILVNDRLPEAKRTGEQALARLEQGHAPADDPGFAWLQARVWNDIGMIESRSGRRSEAGRAFTRARDLLEAIAAARPDDPEVQYSLALMRNHIALFELEDGHRAEARKLATAARDVARSLRDQSPRSRDVCHLYAVSTVNLASTLDRDGETEAAERLYQEAIAALRDLTQRFPNVRVFRRELASALHDLGSACQDHERELAQAIDLLREAIAIERAELESGEAAAEARFQLGSSLLSLAEALRLQGEQAESQPALQDAIIQAQTGQSESPEDARFPRLLVALNWSLAATSAELGDHATIALTLDDQVPLLDDLAPELRSAALRRAAMYYARAARLAADDHTLGTDESSSAVQSYRRLALQCLQAAVEQGYSRAALAADDEFTELHDMEDFRALVRGS